MRVGLLIALLGLVGSGCASQIKGSLQVDGAPFELVECRSGARYGLAGVELSDASGKRVRASIDVSGFTPASSSLSAPAESTAEVAVLKPGASRASQPVLSCGRMTVHNQAGRVIYRNVEGTADLSCANEEPSVAGHVEFAYCH